MKILVCVKSVPAPESKFRVNAQRTGYDRSGLVFLVNEYDLFAVEEAVRIKERFADVSITVASVGAPPVIEQIRKAMALGAQEGLLFDDSGDPAPDAFSTASLIAEWARGKRFDLILCGVMSEDMQRSCTGPMLAELLNLPCATTVIAQNISDDRATVTCERELEGGRRERVLLPLPAVLTIQSGINVPRYASLTNVLRVKDYDVPAIKAGAITASRPRSEIVKRAWLPEKTGACEMLTGDLETMAETLAEKIRSKVARG